MNNMYGINWTEEFAGEAFKAVLLVGGKHLDVAR